MIKKASKSIFVLYATTIIASLLGIYGQDISYFIYNNIGKFPLEYCITVITITSIILFIIPHILSLRWNARDKKIELYYIINLLAGGTISVFSMFVLIMWWG